MRLYNIFESIILEEVNKKILTEGVLEDLKTAMENTYNIWITYQESDGSTTDRYIQVDGMGTTSKGNLAIRAWQLAGKSGKSEPYGWKLFRVDRIISNSVRPTGMRYFKRIADLPSYRGPNQNRVGDNSLTNVSKANYKYN